LKVRPAERRDGAALASLSTQLGYECLPDDFIRRLEEARAASESDVLVADDEGGNVVGWIGVSVVRPISSDARVEIVGLVVDEKYRSQQVGAMLLRHAEEWATVRGYRAIGLHCNVKRVRAHPFYERNGYREEKTQKVFRKTLGV
jgi:GNAT superfamily N-acetyltransferase